jgi:hypothetical protein
MGAFDYVMTLMSFVYALAITHLLATVGDIIGAWPRVRFSWLNAAWMLFSLLGILAWWLGLWHAGSTWRMDQIAIFFVLAAILYVQARLVCARIPSEGEVDLVAFHAQAGRRYMTSSAVLAALTVAINLYYFGFNVGHDFEKNYAVAGSFVCSVIGVVSPRRPIQVAVVIALCGLWIWYFSDLQTALT